MIAGGAKLKRTLEAADLIDHDLAGTRGGFGNINIGCLRVQNFFRSGFVQERRQPRRHYRFSATRWARDEIGVGEPVALVRLLQIFQRGLSRERHSLGKLRVDC